MESDTTRVTVCTCSHEYDEIKRDTDSIDDANKALGACLVIVFCAYSNRQMCMSDNGTRNMRT